MAIPDKYRTQLQGAVTTASKKYGVPEDQIWSIIEVESGGNPSAKSKTGPLGAMQVSTATAKDAGYTKAEMLDPTKNIDAGTKKYKSDLDYFGGDQQKAHLAYNQGRQGAIDMLSGKRAMAKEGENYMNNPKFNPAYLTKTGAKDAQANTDTSQAVSFATGSHARWEEAHKDPEKFSPDYLSKNNPSNNNKWTKADSTVSSVEDPNQKADDEAMKKLNETVAGMSKPMEPPQHSVLMQSQLNQLAQTSLFNPNFQSQGPAYAAPSTTTQLLGNQFAKLQNVQVANNMGAF